MRGIWIPIEILHDNKLTMQEKLLLCEIIQLEMLDKGCVASNKHFGEKLNISPKSVSNTISSLSSKGYIRTHIVEGSRNMLREIFTIHKYGNYYPQIRELLSIKDGETKENKQEKLIKEFITLYPDTSKEAISILEDFISYRKQIKKPLKTIEGLKGFVSKLKEIAQNGGDIEESIKKMKANEWQTVY